MTLSTLRNICVVDDHRYVLFFVLTIISSFMTYHRILTRITRRLPLVQQELFTLPKHPSSSSVISGVRRAQYWTFCESLLVSLSLFFLYCLMFGFIFPFGILKRFDDIFKYTLANTLIVLATELHISTLSKWLVAGRRFSPGTAVSSTNKTYLHNITEIFLKVALSTITPSHNLHNFKAGKVSSSSYSASKTAIFNSSIVCTLSINANEMIEKNAC